MTFTVGTEPLRLTDPRCQALLDVSDLRLLSIVAERFPTALPAEEWAALQARVAPVFDPDEYLAWEQRNEADATIRPPLDIEAEWHNAVHTARWMCARHFLLRDLRTPFHPIRILDIGAHIGVQAIDLANHLQHATVYTRNHGMEGYVERTAKLFSSQPNTFVPEMGDHRSPPLPKDCDLIWAGEILEHIWDWRTFVETVEACAKPGARLVYSVPHGPWEIGQPMRGHVAHWTPDSIQDVFGRKAGLDLVTAPTVPGWSVFTYHAHTGPLGAFDDARLLREAGF